MRLSSLFLLLLPAFALVGSERMSLRSEDHNNTEKGTIHWHRCPEPSSSEAFVIPAVVSSPMEWNPDGTKLALFQCWEFDYTIPSVPGLETASLIPWGHFAESFQFDIKGAYHQPPHAPPAVSLIVFTSGEGTMTIPGTGQKWREGAGISSSRRIRMGLMRWTGRPELGFLIFPSRGLTLSPRIGLFQLVRLERH
ncbi:hypothetical protein C7212DRAFT_363480 [Tuber magnatum]|uniref:Uncharacterized protein n=1 Tax=Tuber magnatum TaxID=42249 RepID=A0A317ST10_9PEZI|nr:hypothetical protein C7212DRAFT_363480 [Tuber magnatum]